MGRSSLAVLVGHPQPYWRTQAGTERGVGHGVCPRHDADGSASLLAVTVASNEQNPVLIIIVVAIAGLTVLVSMVVGMMVWRR